MSDCELTNDSVKKVMDAVVARGADLPAIFLGLMFNQGITDEGAFAIAEVLPNSRVTLLQVNETGIRTEGVLAILKAAEKVPCMKTLLFSAGSEPMSTFKKQVTRKCKMELSFHGPGCNTMQVDF